MPALPVPCREILAETLKDTVQRADVSLHFDTFFTLAAARAVMMLFILLGILLFSLWRVTEIAEPEPVQEASSKPSKLLAVDKLLQAVPIPVPPLLSGGGLPTNLPEICPPYMRASQGVKLSLAISIAESSGGTQVFGLGGSVMRGAPTCLLTAHLLQGETNILELREQEPGKDPSEASKVLLSATSEMDLWKGEVESGEKLGRMQCTTLEGGPRLRQRFVLKREDAKQSVALSAGTTLELGLMDTGRLMASCEKADQLIITVKPDIDAVFALGCILLVLLFGAPEMEASQKQSNDVQ